MSRTHTTTTTTICRNRTTKGLISSSHHFNQRRWGFKTKPTNINHFDGSTLLLLLATAALIQSWPSKHDPYIFGSEFMYVVLSKSHSNKKKNFSNEYWNVDRMWLRQRERKKIADWYVVSSCLYVFVYVCVVSSLFALPISHKVFF